MKKKIEGTWKGEYFLSSGQGGALLSKNISFLFHVVYNDAFGGFEALIEDDPEFYGKEIKARAFGFFANNQIEFVKITDHTFILPPFGPVSQMYECEQSFEVKYKGHLNSDESWVGFWESHSVFRRITERIVHLRSGDGTWTMSRLG